MDAEIVALYRSIIESNLPLPDKLQYFDEIRKLRPASENRWNFRWVILALALVATLSPLALASGWVTTLPEGVLGLSSTAVGALAAYVTSGLKK